MPLPVIGLMVLASIAIIVYSLWPKPAQDKDSVRNRLRGGTSHAPAAAAAAVTRQPAESTTRRLIKSVAPTLRKPIKVNAEEMSKLRVRLANAGYRSENVTTMYLASKTIVAAAAVGLGIAYAWSKGYTMQHGAGLAVFGAALGFMAPNIWLSMAVSKRGELIRKGLPDTLDLMVISVESGLGLDAALQRVSDEMRLVHPALAEELQIITAESQFGIPRAEALAHFDERTGLPEVKSLVAIVNQAERFGTSIARALRNQSDALRVKRRQRAEERAQQTTVKLMVPLILFIFPAILVVLGGPAALKMYEAFTKGGLSGG